MHNDLFQILALVLLLAAGPVIADDDVDTTESPWRLGLAIGYGERSNPIIQSDAVPIIIDVDIAWFGERAFFDNGDAGYTFYQGAKSTLSLVGRINSDRLFFTRTDTRVVTGVVSVVDPTNPTGPGGVITITEPVSVPDRDYAIEAGFELLTDGDWGRLQLAAYHDVRDTHGGFEIYASYARGFRSNRWFFEPSFTLGFKSAKLNDYYWGVSSDESGLLLPAYKAGSGVNVGTRMMLNYQVDRHWAAVTVLNYEKLASTITGSPLVKDDYVFGHYLGLQYRF